MSSKPEHLSTILHRALLTAAERQLEALARLQEIARQDESLREQIASDAEYAKVEM